MYLFLDSEQQLRRSKEFSDLGIKVNRVFKGSFFTKKAIKQTGYAWIFLQISLKCEEFPQSPSLFQSQRPFFLLPSLFQEYLNPPDQDQRNSKQAQC